MEQIEERLIEEVRKYENLYVTTRKDYKDPEITNNSWREIAEILGMDVETCIKKWRFLRDKYVRLIKKMASCRGDSDGDQKVPVLCLFLSWLEPHVKHRHTSSNHNKEPKKKRRREIDDSFENTLERLEECQLTIEKRLQDTGDEYSRFGQIVADLLRKVPPEKRDSLMYEVYGMIHAQRQ
ncbi:uncharacterized protein PAE49_010858 [Odontesthes bonariensis]